MNRLIVGIFLCLGMWGNTSTLWAQPQAVSSTPMPLSADSSYFFETLPQYTQWLEATNLKAACQVDSLAIQTEKLQLWLSSPNRAHWQGLRESMSDSTPWALEKLLFRKFCFQMELAYAQAEVLIKGKDFYVRVRYADGDFVIDAPRARGEIKNSIQVPLAHLPVVEHMSFSSDEARTKKMITDYLFNFYKDKGTVWSTARQYWIEGENHFLLEVTNIKSEVLDDFFFGYFEYIRIEAEIHVHEDVVDVSYSLQGKYGSGIFRAPRRGGYYDMDPKYLDYLNRYNAKLKAGLQEMLKQNTYAYDH